MRLAARILALLLCVFAAQQSRAHEMTMAEMELRETRPHEFLWQWGQSGAKPLADVLTPVWPQGCEADVSMLRCGPAGLSGVLSMVACTRSGC